MITPATLAISPPLPHDAGVAGNQSGSADCVVGILLTVVSVVAVLGNAVILQVIKIQRRKSVCEYIFAEIALAHCLGGVTAMVSSIILLSGRQLPLSNEQLSPSNEQVSPSNEQVSPSNEHLPPINGHLGRTLSVITSLAWHFVVLLTPMLLCLVVAGRVIIRLNPLRYEEIVNATYVVTGSIVSCIASATGAGIPLIFSGFRIDVDPTWAFPHKNLPSTGSDRYLTIGCFLGPFLLLELTLLFMIVLAVADVRRLRRETSETPKTFIQDGLRTILAQTMVPLPTVLEGSEHEQGFRRGSEESQVAMETDTTDNNHSNNNNNNNHGNNHTNNNNCSSNNNNNNNLCQHDIEMTGDKKQAREIMRWMDESARVISASSSQLSQCDSVLSWSVRSTPTSLRNGSRHTTRPAESSNHTPGSTSSRSVFARHSLWNSVLSRFSLYSPAPGGAGTAAARSKEQQIKLISLHLSLSLLLSHVVLTVYGVASMLGTEGTVFRESRVYLRGCYHASVFLNSAITPAVFWSFHQRYRERVSFYFYKVKIVLTLIANTCLMIRGAVRVG